MAKSDPLCYAQIRKASQESPDTPSYGIDRCGHYIPLGRPEELTKTLHRILEEDIYSLTSQDL